MEFVEQKKKIITAWDATKGWANNSTSINNMIDERDNLYEELCDSVEGIESIEHAAAADLDTAAASGPSPVDPSLTAEAGAATSGGDVAGGPVLQIVKYGGEQMEAISPDSRLSLSATKDISLNLWSWAIRKRDMVLHVVLTS